MECFYIPPSRWDLDKLILSEKEFHHCVRVLRKQKGDKIQVFNGEGLYRDCEIAKIHKEELFLKILANGEEEVKFPKFILHLAIPKFSVMDSLLSKAVELGVDKIQPLITDRSLIKGINLSKKKEKWEQIILGACKQSGHYFLPEILLPLSFDSWINDFSGQGLKIVASLFPNAKKASEVFKSEEEKEIHFLVGPEGDFTNEEMNLAIRKEFMPVSFGSFVLRVETAVIYGLSLLQYEFRH